MNKRNARFLFPACVLAALVLLSPGCSSTDQGAELPDRQDSSVSSENDQQGQLFPELQQATDYYWPWISHGQVELSSGEIIIGPDLFESDLGFIGEFVTGDRYEGRLLWQVAESDVFLLDWVALTFDADFFKQSEWESTSVFEFRLENLPTEPGDDGVQRIPVSYTERHGRLEVGIYAIELGKEAEGTFTTDPISYVAFDIIMTVVENQE